MFRSTTRLLALVGAALVLTIALAACSSSSAPSAPAATSAPTVAPASAAPTTASAAPSTAGGGGATGTAVSIIDFAFDPAALTAKVGQEVTWTNSGAAPHTVTFDSGGIDSGNLSPGGTFKHTFDAAGTFSYHCNIHSIMKATVTVSQ
ncbi:MAG: cupredoxin family copper-binding protein [Chloroflexota bacterium]